MKNSTRLLIAIFTTFLITSCVPIDEKAIEVAGIYDATVINGYYNFDLNISMDGYDDVLIEALFDDYDFSTVRADLDDHGNGLIDFDIRWQDIYNGARIKGDGEYIDGFLQLDYTIDWGNERVKYRIVADRY